MSFFVHDFSSMLLFLLCSSVHCDSHVSPHPPFSSKPLAFHVCINFCHCQLPICNIILQVILDLCVNRSTKQCYMYTSNCSNYVIHGIHLSAQSWPVLSAGQNFNYIFVSFKVVIVFWVLLSVLYNSCVLMTLFVCSLKWLFNSHIDYMILNTSCWKKIVKFKWSPKCNKSTSAHKDVRV